MKALVTGVAGFVGSTLSERLLTEGYDVVGIDSLTDYYDPAIKRDNLTLSQKNARFKFIQADLNEIALLDLLDGVEVVFHQAGQPGVRKSWGVEFEAYALANVMATQRLLEAARSSDCLRKFVYASSSSVYGEAESYPTTETDRPKPRSPYGVTKLAAEHLTVLYAANFGVPTVSLRYFTVYGPRQRPDMAFTNFTRDAIEGREISVYGDGEQIREFTYVDDIVKANLLAGERPTDPGVVINLSGGASVSVNEVLTQIEEIHGSPINVHRGEVVPGDVRRTGGSTERAQELLGWSPKVNLRDGLQAQYEWMNQLVARS
jgi:UDP-glucose 4-epimerase